MIQQLFNQIQLQNQKIVKLKNITLSDSNIPIEEVLTQAPKTHSNKEIEIDIDQLSYQRMFSSNEIDQEFDFIDAQKSNSQIGVSPGLSITSYDLEQTDKNLEIQPYGSVSYNQREVPQIVLALRRRPAQIQIPQVTSQNQESCKTLSNFSFRDLPPMQMKKLQVKSQIEILLFEIEEDEIYSVYDDEINHYGILPQSKIDFLDHLHQFLTLYKMRAGTFPRQRENLENEIIYLIQYLQEQIINYEYNINSYEFSQSRKIIISTIFPFKKSLF